MNKKIQRHTFETDPRDGLCKICRKTLLDGDHISRNARGKSSRRYF